MLSCSIAVVSSHDRFQKPAVLTMWLLRPTHTLNKLDEANQSNYKRDSNYLKPVTKQPVIPLISTLAKMQPLPLTYML